MSVDEGHWDRTRGPQSALQWTQWEALGDPIPRMKDSALGTGLLEQWLEEVRVAVEQDGELTEVAIQKLVQAFRGKPNSLTRELEELRLKLHQNPDGLDAASLREKQKNQVLAFLNRKLAGLASRRAQCEEREQTTEQARQAASVLPSLEVLEKILRYETKLERHMCRAMAHLERLQRMRRGDAVAAPVAVEVSAGA